MTAATDFKNIKSETKSKIDELTSQQNKTFTNTIRNVFFVGILLAILAFAGMIVLQVIQGIFVIVVTVLFGFAGIMAIRHMRGLDSIIAEKVHNWIIEQRIKEARENAIITLKRILITKKEEVQAAISDRAILVGDLNKLKHELDQTDPTKDRFYARKKDMFTKLQTASNKNDSVIREMQSANEEFEQEIKMFESMEKFAETASRLAKAFDNNTISDMLSLEAFDAIEERYCHAMAELETVSEFS